MNQRCAVCNQKIRRRGDLEVLTEDVRVPDYPKRGLWFLLEKGQPLCTYHPRLDARFKPTEAMTGANPRWYEFINRLKGPEGCNFREEPGRYGLKVFLSDGKPSNHSFTRTLLAEMGLESKSVEATIQYFCSWGKDSDNGVAWIPDPHGTP